MRLAQVRERVPGPGLLLLAALDRGDLVGVHGRRVDGAVHAHAGVREPKPRNPRNFGTIEGGKVCQALHIESKSVLDALCRVKKCLRRSM